MNVRPLPFHTSVIVPMSKLIEEPDIKVRTAPRIECRDVRVVESVRVIEAA